ARRRGTNAIAFVLATDEWAAAGQSGPAAVVGHTSADTGRRGDPAAISLLQSAGWRVITVHQGDSLAVAWSRACAGSAAYQRTGDRHVPLPARS
ncbi:MAG: hypothetical protein ABWZ98_04000, partial [Nakamurella sp.]